MLIYYFIFQQVRGIYRQLYELVESNNIKISRHQKSMLTFF